MATVEQRSATIEDLYRSDPEHAVTYRRGETAEAEPAVPGWRVAVDRIFG